MQNIHHHQVCNPGEELQGSHNLFVLWEVMMRRTEAGRMKLLAHCYVPGIGFNPTTLSVGIVIVFSIVVGFVSCQCFRC